MLLGQRMGPFEVEKQLGSGAMGAVYLARYSKTGQRVALKVMVPGLGGNETALARFEREAQVLKQLNHPNIVRFYVASQFQGTRYYAMEYIEGESLDHVLQRRSRLAWEEVVELGRQMCAALQHAHHQGIVHRDLKPSNLMITADGTLKLTDFGIAKDLDVTQLTAANCTVGTAAYMSPEQCRGERNLTHKSDLYSLGVLLYELLTGRRPFQAETTMDMFLQHVNAVPERPSRIVFDIPVWLDTLVCQLLEKKPEHRPFDAAVVAQALDQVAEKVVAQRSAGMDAVRASRVNRALGESPIAETDKKIARTLLTGMQHKRRKRRTKPLYERGWFQAAGISLVLLALAAILYLAFRTPSAEQFFAQAQRLMETKKQEDAAHARNGPIKDYLENYGDRTDAQSRQIREWADRYDVALLEQQLENRQRLKLSPEGEAETRARKAVHFEDVGDWGGAQEQWSEVAKLKTDADRELRVWGLLAEKRIEEVATAAAFENELMTQVPTYSLNLDIFKAIAVRNAQQAAAASSEVDLGAPMTQAHKAVRYELFGDRAAARAAWQELKTRYERDMGQRVWLLLAAKRIDELNRSMPAVTKEAVDSARLEHIKDALEAARKLGAENRQPELLQALRNCGDILDLYHHYPDFRDSPDPGLKQLVEQAQVLRNQLAPAEHKRE
jgi:predicted Ser/Thr protein kinase